jgi:hypothetical protein
VSSFHFLLERDSNFDLFVLILSVGFDGLFQVAPGSSIRPMSGRVTSSRGHVIISAILFTFLGIALVAAQFRKGRVAFTLVNVAAALADSDVPQKCMEMTQFKAGMGERKVLKLVPGGDGRLYCVYESND